MAYTKQTWVDTSSGGTPISAARLGVIEDGIEATAIVADSGQADATTGIANAAAAQGDATQALADAAAAQVTADAAVAETLIDAKGDLLVGTAPDVAARLPVGVDGRILQANSTPAAGVSWGLLITVSATAPPAPVLGDLWLKPVV